MNTVVDPPVLELEVQQRLNAHYVSRLCAPERCHEAPGLAEMLEMERLQALWMDVEVARCQLRDVPTSAAHFESWYRTLFKRSVAQAQPFFDHIAERASLPEMALYVCFEQQVDGRFDDVIALAQLGLEGAAKLALARNYWDEMGEGVFENMHTVLFEKSAAYFRAALAGTPLEKQLATTADALKNGNVLLLLALNRRYALRLLGALTLLEHTAPRRFAKTVAGMRRLGVPEEIVYYHEMHVRIDAKHGEDLLHEIVLPLIERHPEAIPEIAQGMAIRYNVAADYYASLIERFGLSNAEAASVA